MRAPTSKAAPTAARKVRLETPNYILRTVELDDAGDAWAQWLTDAETARTLNTTAKAASVDQIRAYIASFNSINSFLLGIFDKETGEIVGIHAIYVNWDRREFLLNLLIGPTSQRNKGAMSETRNVVLDIFFNEFGLDTALGSVVADNTKMLAIVAKAGWQPVGTVYKASAIGAAPVEVRNFKLTRETFATRDWKRV